MSASKQKREWHCLRYATPLKRKISYRGLFCTVRIIWGGSRTHGLLNIPIHDFFDIHIVMQKIREEQQKIGSLVLMFDRAISLHRLKLEQLKQVKKAFLQAMFPPVEVEGKE